MSTRRALGAAVLAALVFVAACSSSDRTSPPASVTDRRISTVTTADTGRPTATSAVDVRAVGLRNRDGWCVVTDEGHAERFVKSGLWAEDGRCLSGTSPRAAAAR